MATRGTVCKLCKSYISANGSSAARAEIRNHLLNKHPKEYQDFIKARRNLQDVLKEQTDALRLIAETLIEDSEMIMPHSE